MRQLLSAHPAGIESRTSSQIDDLRQGAGRGGEVGAQRGVEGRGDARPVVAIAKQEAVPRGARLQPQPRKQLPPLQRLQQVVDIPE